VLPGSPDGSVDAVCDVDEGLVSENAPIWSMPCYNISLSQVQCSPVSCLYLPLGFEVTLVLNATRQQMEEALAAFHRQLRPGGLGLFYFAGHEA
jgi:hypothetical protein